MYIAPSSGHISLNFIMPFKLILRRFEVVFWCLEWECSTFWKIDGNWIKSLTLAFLIGAIETGANVVHSPSHISSRLGLGLSFMLAFIIGAIVTGANVVHSQWPISSRKTTAAISTTFSIYSPSRAPLRSYTGPSLVQNVLPHPGILRVGPQHLVTYVDGIHISLGLHVVECKLVACETWKDVKSQFIIKINK